ncbi:MAG: carboxylesterase family protein [Microbacterium sp.]|uniref:carboxylesterase/lipase family protein n=1 Tax=Microbacterium sp. TaxID=51671 RepID=UPI0039E36F6A
MPDSSGPPVVRTSRGRLIGTRDGSVSAFLGVPFAAPPVGPLRWRPPAPVAPWEEARPADRFGPAPVQSQPPTSSVMWHTNFADRQALVMSEDCLYLNVWTPDPSPGARLPVMVWLHGGGNRFGHGGQEIHHGDRLAARGIVVVTVNMRLGALGFLALPGLAEEDEAGASGNYALLDVVAALQWVREEIAAFGGDPGAVTLAGNSAGAAIVTHLQAAPAARGLFHAAIGQSSAGAFRADGPLPTQERAQQRGRDAVAPLGTDDVDRLRRLPATSFLLPADWGIVLDGRLLTRDTTGVLRAGEHAPVPLLVGSNTDEGAVYTPRTQVAELRTLLSRPDRAALRPHYPVDEASAAASARAFVGETRFVYPIWRWARAHVETTGAPTWVYRFDRHPPLPTGPELAPPPDGGAAYGAYHTAELAYAADTLDCRPWEWTERDRELAAEMSAAWARFVQTHDPRGGAIRAWTPFDGTPYARVLVLGDATREEGVRRVEALLALDALPRPV